MRRRPPSTRLLGALAIALLMVVSFGGKLHEGLVPHAICAEHGESVELSAGAAAPLTFDAGPRESKIVERSEDDGTAHEHCDLALLSRTKDLLDTRLAPTTLWVSEAQGAVKSTAASAELSVPLLLLAPKHSPPAIA